MNTSTKILFHLTSYYLIIFQTISSATDTIDATHSIRDDGATIISASGRFELGFFSPARSANRFLGIWFRNVTAGSVYWVANRDSPIQNKSGLLKLTDTGILVLTDEQTNGTIWSSNVSSPGRNINPAVAQLLDSGNLVVREAEAGDDGDYLWQSNDHPSDTFLPGMGLGWNLVTGTDTHITSWKSDDDPASGDYTYSMDLTGYPQIYIKKNDVIQTRLGPWNGLRFRWRTNPGKNSPFKVVMVMNQTQVIYTLFANEDSVLYKFALSPDGFAQLLSWVGPVQEWRAYMKVPADDCDKYRLCGVYASCNIGSSPMCMCLNKFVPRYSDSWVRADWSEGCIRRVNLSCKGDGFLRYSGMKLPEARSTQHKEGLSLEDCRMECMRNCSCTAYSQLDLKTQSGCLFWYEDLIDMRDVGLDGQDIYVRVAASELDSGEKNRDILIGSLTAGIGTVVLLLGLFLYRKKRNKSKRRKEGQFGVSNQEDSELPFFEYSAIVKATDNFSFRSKVGEGGFGPVFKGRMEDGQEIAVKCLSSTSRQGITEFKNEAIFIAKLQHRNLVRLLGCCIQANENMLIYEYMSNGSLDLLLFDKSRNALLDWPTRFKIINGIARGILYLHQDSRLRIIHRDLKASNILLDSDLNPKISDFGTARSFGGNESGDRTRRVVGTYGYMSPEYAVDGIFSVKSDVFSFGVLVLEIVSGKKNRGFAHDDHYLNLLGHAWTLYKEERQLELLDTSLTSFFDTSQVSRSIHVGLLCVQKRMEDRPTMSTVVLMLGNDGVLPAPTHPGFFMEREVISDNSSRTTTISTNEMTITLPQGR